MNSKCEPEKQKARKQTGRLPRRILVTGGAGFIGANLVRALCKRGDDVTVFDNLCAGRREYLENLAVRFVEGDILNRSQLEEVVHGQDGVVHLAAQTSVPGSLADPQRDCQVNIVGTLNLLQACRQARDDVGPNHADSQSRQGPRFIFASSNAPLGRQAPPATEDKAPLPISPYGASKLAGEAYCLAYHGSWELPTVALRFGNVYGPFSAHKNSVVAKFFRDLAAGRSIVIDGDGKQTRDFIYVGDLCRAISLALDSTVSGEVFQVATGVETTIGTLVTLIEAFSDNCLHVEYGPARQGDIRRNYSVISKSRALLGWEPHIDMPKGLAMTRNWFHDQAGQGRSKEVIVRSPAASTRAVRLGSENGD